ncbi:methionine--trna ligase, partial [Cystoisospora suis]
MLLTFTFPSISSISNPSLSSFSLFFFLLFFSLHSYTPLIPFLLSAEGRSFALLLSRASPRSFSSLQGHLSDEKSFQKNFLSSFSSSLSLPRLHPYEPLHSPQTRRLYEWRSLAVKNDEGNEERERRRKEEGRGRRDGRREERAGAEKKKKRRKGRFSNSQTVFTGVEPSNTQKTVCSLGLLGLAFSSSVRKGEDSSKRARGRRRRKKRRLRRLGTQRYIRKAPVLTGSSSFSFSDLSLEGISSPYSPSLRYSPSCFFSSPSFFFLFFSSPRHPFSSSFSSFASLHHTYPSPSSFSSSHRRRTNRLIFPPSTPFLSSSRLYDSIANLSSSHKRACLPKEKNSLYCSSSSSSSSLPVSLKTSYFSSCLTPTKRDGGLHALRSTEDSNRRRFLTSESDCSYLVGGDSLQASDEGSSLSRRKEQERRRQEAKEGGEETGEDDQESTVREEKKVWKEIHKERREEGDHRSSHNGVATTMSEGKEQGGEEEETEQGREEVEEKDDVKMKEKRKTGENEVWKNVRMVTCPLFYSNDYMHIGHAYSLVLGDTLVRFARSRQGFYDPILREDEREVGEREEEEEERVEQGKRNDKKIRERREVRKNREDEEVHAFKRRERSEVEYDRPFERIERKKENEGDLEKTSGAGLLETSLSIHRERQERRRVEGRDEERSRGEDKEDQREEGESKEEEERDAEGEEGCILLTGADEHGGKVVRAAVTAWRDYLTHGVHTPEKNEKKTRQNNDEREEDQITQYFARLHPNTLETSSKSSSPSPSPSPSFFFPSSSPSSSMMAVSPGRIVKTFVDAISENNLRVFKKLYLLPLASGALRFFRTNASQSLTLKQTGVSTSAEALRKIASEKESEETSSLARAHRLYTSHAKRLDDDDDVNYEGREEKEGGVRTRDRGVRTRQERREGREMENAKIFPDGRRDGEDRQEEECLVHTKEMDISTLRDEDHPSSTQRGSTYKKEGSCSVIGEKNVPIRWAGEVDKTRREEGEDEDIEEVEEEKNDASTCFFLGYEGGRAQEEEEEEQEVTREEKRRRRLKSVSLTTPRSQHEASVWELWSVLERKGLIYQKSSSSLSSSPISSSSSSFSFLFSHGKEQPGTKGSCNERKKRKDGGREEAARRWEGEEEEEHVWDSSRGTILERVEQDRQQREKEEKKTERWMRNTKVEQFECQAKEEEEKVDGNIAGGRQEEEDKDEDENKNLFYFRLTHFEQPLLRWYEENPDFISPRSRMNEVLSFVSRGGLRDLVISRPRRAYGLYPLHRDFSPFSDLVSRKAFQERALQQSSHFVSFSETTEGKLGEGSREKDDLKKTSKRRREVRESLDLLSPSMSLNDDNEVSYGVRRVRRGESRSLQDADRDREHMNDALRSSISGNEKEEQEEDDLSDFSWGIRIPPQEYIDHNDLSSSSSSSFSSRDRHLSRSNPLISSSFSSSPPPSCSPLLSHEREREKNQVVYVWLDALTAYLTAAGYPQRHSRQFKRLWPPSLQIVGKDILRFHAILFPALLLGADLPLPRRLLVHGWWTDQTGKKLSKSHSHLSSSSPPPSSSSSPSSSPFCRSSSSSLACVENLSVEKTLEETGGEKTKSSRSRNRRDNKEEERKGKEEERREEKGWRREREKEIGQGESNEERTGENKEFSIHLPIETTQGKKEDQEVKKKKDDKEGLSSSSSSSSSSLASSSTHHHRLGHLLKDLLAHTPADT